MAPLHVRTYYRKTDQIKGNELSYRLKYLKRFQEFYDFLHDTYVLIETYSRIYISFDFYCNYLILLRNKCHVSLSINIRHDEYFIMKQW